MQIPFEELPSHIAKSFDAKGLISNKGHKKTSPFGAVKSDFPVVKNTNKKGQTSWTLRLSTQNISDEVKSSSNLYFDNLVIKELKDKSLAKYIFRYFPKEEWYYSTGRTLSNYTGKISVFNINGENTGNTRVENGKGINKQYAGEGKMTTCTLALNDIVCFGGEGSMLDQPFTCTYIYDIGSCTEDTSGGGDDFTYNPDPNIGVSESDDTATSGTGGGTNDGSDEVETLPLLDHCLITNTCEEEMVVQITNLLEGKARCAFNKLRYGNVDLYNKTIGVFDNNDYYNLTIGYGSCNGTADDGCTNGIEIANGCVSIDIQSVGTSTLDLAATILHEGIHAEIYKYVYEYKAGIDPNNRKNLLYWYFQYKAQNGGDVATRDAQHQFMPNNYVSKIANAIRELDNKQYSIDYYMGFAWDGLRTYGWDGYYDNGQWILLPKKDDFDAKKAVVLSNTKFNNDCAL